MFRYRFVKKLSGAVMASALLCGCAGNNGAPDNSISSALSVLETVWNSYAEEERFFVVGGNQENAKEGAPAAFDVEKTEELESMFLVPKKEASSVEDAASMVHAMNTNVFSSVVFQIKEGVDIKSFMAMLEKEGSEKKWLCGAPEILSISQLNEDTISLTFGTEENVKKFVDILSSKYKDILTIQENIA